MTDIKSLREQQARIATNARAKFNEISGSTDEARAAEIEREFDGMMSDHDKVGLRIERLQKLEEAEARANAGDARRPRGENVEARGQDEGLKVEYREVFAKAICGPLDDLSAEERAVLRRGATELRTQTAGTNSAGGFTVPTELMAQIEVAMKAHGPMWDANVITEIRTTSGNPMRMPFVDDTAKVAVAHTEGGAVTDDGGEDATFSQRSLDAFSYDTEWVKWSWELDMDSIFSMEALLGSLLGERLGRTANTQLTTGTGSSVPQRHRDCLDRRQDRCLGNGHHG